MRLYSIETEGRRGIGVEVADGQILDLGQAQLELPCGNTTLCRMEDFIAAGDRALDWARTVAERSLAPALDPANVRILAPLSRPEKIICVGLNYMDHCREQNIDPPANPIIFPKFSNCLAAPGDPIVLPPISEKVDYEGELGVVIGRGGKAIAEQSALDCVFGYTIVNDISARDVQYGDKQWTRGKVSDTFAPLGPCIVTADEIPDPQTLGIRTILNGDVVQDSTTAEMIFPVKHLIAYLSQGITFKPGDLISTGTPDGVGVWRDPQIFLKPGDVVRVEIETIGALENPVISGSG